MSGLLQQSYCENMVSAVLNQHCLHKHGQVISVSALLVQRDAVSRQTMTLIVLYLKGPAIKCRRGIVVDGYILKLLLIAV